jgi:outer membrane protein OmpA-like peptidoglycan-associated protein
MNIKTKSSVGLSLALLLGGCASVPPAQLVETRIAYINARDGQTGKLSPTALYEAEKALVQANQEFAEHGDTTAVRDLAYIAQRKLELADSKARTELDRQKIADASKVGVAVRDRQVKEGQAALASSREELQYERNANKVETTELKATNAAQGKALEKSADDLDAEKKARQAAEAKLAVAMKDLAAFAAIKEEPRGLVITLSGSILFASNKYALLESAQTKLDQVAEALKDQSDDKTMVVEGHTDSHGSDAINQPLSRNRAAAVREYLVGRGVDAKKITAVGLGSSRPLLDNKNAENRANNRRVEIVIHSSNASSP